MPAGMSWLDVKLGLRMLVKYPGLAVVGVLAIGIGLVGLGLGDQIAQEGPGLLLAVSAIVMVVGLLACVVPARRVLRIQPTEALREA